MAVAMTEEGRWRPAPADQPLFGPKTPQLVERRAQALLHALKAAPGQRIEDRFYGRATRKLLAWARLEREPIGSLQAVLVKMEREGLIEREIVSKRTYAIWLGPKGKEHQCSGCPTPQELTPLSVVRDSGPVDWDEILSPREPDPEEALDLEEPKEAGFDYDELARRVLAQALNQTAAAEERVTAARAELETKLAEVQDSFDSRLAAKEREWRTARDEITEAAEAAIQDAERSRDALKIRVEEQDEELETLRRALEKHKAKAERTERGLYQLREHLRPEGIAVLERLMKQPPGDRGSP